MALEQIVAVKNSVILYQNPRPVTSSPFFTLNPKPSRRSSFMARVKWSFDYNGSGTAPSNNSGLYEYERHATASPQYPKPAEIQWKKEICNSVQLIGVIGAPVEIKHLPSGKILAWSRLAVKKSQTDTFWISLTLWDELAQVAFQHVEKGHQVYVSGRLVSDTVENDDGKHQTYYKVLVIPAILDTIFILDHPEIVSLRDRITPLFAGAVEVVVQQLNFIERGVQSVPLYDGDSNSATPGRKQYATNSTGSTVQLWQAFFANPLEWWDNRKNKRNPKYPDFKHKDTGEALWVEGRYNPSWVKSQLAVLDSKMELFHERNSRTPQNFMCIESLGPF
ncbi:hypothetical protein OROMI_029480 [Orobanche minor]